MKTQRFIKVGKMEKVKLITYTKASEEVLDKDEAEAEAEHIENLNQGEVITRIENLK